MTRKDSCEQCLQESFESHVVSRYRGSAAMLVVVGGRAGGVRGDVIRIMLLQLPYDPLMSGQVVG